jgi:hypothetical protein
MAAFPVCLLFRLCKIGQFQWYKAGRRLGNCGFRGTNTQRNRWLVRPAHAATVSRSRRNAIEAVNKGSSPDMLNAIASLEIIMVRSVHPHA